MRLTVVRIASLLTSGARGRTISHLGGCPFKANEAVDRQATLLDLNFVDVLHALLGNDDRTWVYAYLHQSPSMNMSEGC